MNLNKKWKRDLPDFEWLEGEDSRWLRAKRLGFGEGASIYALSYVYNPENIRVGINTWIGPFTLLDGSGGLLEIGDNCSISAGVQIYTHDSVKWALSSGKEHYSKAPVKIGNNCYIGPYAVIAKGSVIPDGSIIKSHSLIKKMIERRESVNIVYLGGIWPTNIGNAFIDLGSMHSLKMASPNSNINFIGGFAKTLFNLYGKNSDNVFDLLGNVKADYIVLSGNFDDYYFINMLWPIIKKTGAKLIINGMGGATYTKKEITALRVFFKANPPYALISRDENTFINYSGLAEHSYNGLDCGFYVSDYLKPIKLDMPEFIIHNFDKIKASDYVISPLSLLMQAIRIKFHLLKNQSGEVENVDDQLIIRTHHSCLPYVPNKYFSEPNTLISAIPEDYLNLYANTKATYSNRVHACVATLAFNNPAMLFNNTPRAALFDRIGATNIREELTYPDAPKIKEEKSNQIQFLSEIIC